MAKASKTVPFPSAINPAYRGGVSKVQTTMLEWQKKITASPGFKAEIMAQITAFVQQNQ